MTTLEELTEITLRFRDDRDWKQFHSPKELALCLALETAEVVELMQWKDGAALDKHLVEKKTELADELADVLHAVLLLAHDRGIDLGPAYKAKMLSNAQKYPIEKAHGRATKYTEL